MPPGDLVLLRVIPPLRASLMMPPKFAEQTLQQATEISQKYLKGVAERLRAEGITVETETQSGRPAQTILEFAENTDCDLIIIGSHGETASSRWRFGGVANKVVKDKTTMPVLLVTT